MKFIFADDVMILPAVQLYIKYIYNKHILEVTAIKEENITVGVQNMTNSIYCSHYFYVVLSGIP